MTAAGSDVLRYAAFSAAPGGGNPAGVVLDAGGLDDPAMLAIAAEIGYAETAFVISRGPDRSAGLRYFSPHAEVPFCGHATIATAVALAEREGVGPFRFDTPVGPVVIETSALDGVIGATFTSVEPRIRDLEDAVLDELLALLGLVRDDLDRRFPPRESFAGNWHPILTLQDAATFDAFTFAPADMRAIMDREGWTGTVTIVHALGRFRFDSRNLFPVGEITEDPATGSAAASFGGYLRELELVEVPATLEVLQGRHVGRPSLLRVEVPAVGGIRVSGGAEPIPGADVR
ncbi:PhzF family phenazine biosynthesis protein [Amnibacterium flavum]|uniref:Phenazine biosynthesis protein PhzF n=1 Tax=Amnibacterium flavum TaxID=2173173 RepID=A0A2V1HVB5_9MICO|nr:PhzF family phenazine biosynthesis isomerase [Amnibacterium flavum]PVZ94277.1 phenazine biosynthesis protein PhzF [Amnibacterium flavum]